MSRNQNRRSKVIAALAAFGLMIGLGAPRASAQFANMFYSGRYACTSVSDDNLFTAIYKYNPNGAGAYNGGTLVAALNQFDAAFPFPVVSTTGDFCTYTLNLAASSYIINPDGDGFEQLVWVAPTSPPNPGACPGSFTDQTALGLRNDLNVLGQTIRADFASDDLFGDDEPGAGHCLK